MTIEAQRLSIYAEDKKTLDGMCRTIVYEQLTDQRSVIIDPRTSR